MPKVSAYPVTSKAMGRDKRSPRHWSFDPAAYLSWDGLRWRAECRLPPTAPTVRSLAILFQQPDGQEWRTAMINLPVFVVNTPQAFNEFQLASSPDPATGKNIPGAMNAFLAKHPETAAALQAIGKHPFSSGFGDSPYYGLNAFRFVNAQDESTPVRWLVTPDQTFDANSAAPTGKNYLFDGLIAQLHSKPLRWHLILTIGQPGDSTADATQIWPADSRNRSTRER